MFQSKISGRTTYYDDNDSSSNYTTIIIIIVVVFILKICLITWLCYYRRKKIRERAAKGCTCFGSSDYYCTPWWYWSSDRRCHCGALNRTPYNAPNAYNAPSAYNAPPAYTPGSGYSRDASPGYASDPAYPPGQYNMSSANESQVPLKPAEQVQTNGRYY